MPNKLELSDGELALLHLLLSRDLESSRVELRHTAGQPYREYIQQRMGPEEALLERMNEALPSLRPAAAR